MVHTQRKVSVKWAHAAVAFLSVLALLLFQPALATAQDLRASISGTISDPSGAPVPGASVVITDLARGTKFSIVSNQAGRYTSGGLLPSNYSLTVEAKGFKKFVRTNILLVLSQQAGVDVSLELGAVNETVTVTTTAPLLDTETATRGAVLSQEYVQDLPNNGLDLTNLVFAMPGAYQPCTCVGQSNSGGGHGTFEINGDAGGVSGRASNGSVLIDGTDDSNGSSLQTFDPSLYAIDQVQVKTNDYDAQYGRSGGGYVAVTLRSGTNQYHGIIFDYFTSDVLNANSWQKDSTGTKKSPSHSWNYGFEVGGPVIIPKLFNGKDKLFAMLSLGEHTSSASLGASATTVPTAAERQGNFAGLLNSKGAPITIYDPNTAVLNGTTYSRTAFQGNQIPSGRINSMGQTLINLYPLPNQTGVGSAGTNNYEGIVPNSGSNTQWLGRLDFVLSQRNRMYASFGQTDSVTVSPGTFTGVLGNGTSIPGDNNASHGVLDWTTVISPHTTLDLRVGYGRDFSYRVNAAAQGYNPTTLGFPQSLVSQFYGLWFPNFSFSEYGTFGPSNSMNLTGTDNVVSAHADLARIIGTHFLRMGAQLNQYGTASISPGFADGSYSFSPQYTQLNPLAADSTSGNDAADLLLGIATTGTVALNTNPYYENRLWGIYFQDDWKATKRMSLNLGLRWDYDTPLYERHNRIVDGFAFSTASPIAAAVAAAPGTANCPACLALKGGLTYASSGSPYAWQPDYRGIQPRLGVAYQISHLTVFRAGFGMYTLQQAGNQTGSLTEGFSNSTAMQTSLDGGITVASYINNPFPSNLFPNGLIKPVGNTLGLSTLLGTGVYFPTQQAPNSYSYMWSFGLQRELPRQYVIEASYVANKTTGFPLSLGTDSIPNADLGQAQSYYTTKVTNPMAGLLPNNATLNAATIPQQYLLTPYPEFNGLSGGNIPIGWNRYDSLQISLTRHFGNGSSLMVNYDNSKNLMRMSALNGGDYNPTNPNLSLLEERLGTFDVPQKVNFLGTFILPVGRGQHFGASMPKVLDKVVGGWKLGWVWTIQSGFPVPYPNNAAILPGTAEIPPSQRTYYHWYNTSLFPKTAFPANTYRTFPSEFPDVRYMGEKDAEISLMKEFPIYERLKFRIRADFTNAFNHPFFTTMQSSDVTNAQFGQLAVAGGQNNSPRNVLMQGNIIF